MKLSCLFLSQVLSIWEGTTNVLSLDVLRCVARSSGMVLHAYFTHAKVQDQGMIPSDKFSISSMTEWNRNVMCDLVFFSLQSLLAGASSVSSLAPAVKAVDGALSELEYFIQMAATRAPGYLELAARDLAYSLARIYAGRYHSHTNTPPFP